MRHKTIIAVATAVLALGACSDDDAATSDTTAATTQSDETPATEPPVATQPPATDAPEPTEAPPATEAPQTTDAPPTTDAPAPTEAPSTTAAPAEGELPTTPVVGMFADAYTFQGGTPDPALLPAQPGEVEAHWYRAGDVLAVVYVGLDPSVDACPGTSAMVGGVFDFVSNAELPNGSCPDFPTRVENSADLGVQVCDGRVGYLTLIPADIIGQVFASIEKPVPDVGGVGLSSVGRLTDPSALPEIDLAQLAC